ncbi:MAG: hypothetical protein JNJ59_04495, partial [Deltaproteobacteria bacterium]|nr:hypothetical protein [Deltaproteobacteria bacterium]
MEEADFDAKTSAINLADLGMLEDEATVSMDARALKAQAAKAASFDEEKTSAFNVADLPPEDDEPKRAPQKTLLGHPAPKPGAAVRGGAAPVKRSETLALAPQAAKQAIQSAQSRSSASVGFDEEKTSALSLDDIDKIDALPAKAAPKVAARSAAAVSFDDEKTSALSLDDIDKIDALPSKAPPAKPSALKAAPKQIEESEKTMAVPLDDAIAAIDRGGPSRKPAAVASRGLADAGFQEEKTTAMSLDDIDAIVDAPKKAAAPQAALPARAKAAQAKAPAAKAADIPTGEGFLGSIAYVFQHDALEARMKAGKTPRA